MLKKIVSGGQTGADIAGVIIAHAYGLETGGWMPKGFMTQAGPRPDLAEKYKFQEHESPKYPPRTFANVKDADGTIRFAAEFGSSGEICTMKAITQYKKPHIDIDVKKPRPVQEVVEWINRHNISVLNVAGNSERTFPGMAGEVIEYLDKVFKALGLSERKNNASI